MENVTLNPGKMGHDILNFMYNYNSIIMSYKTMLDVYSARTEPKVTESMTFFNKALESERRELKRLSDELKHKYLELTVKPPTGRYKWGNQNPQVNANGIPTAAKLVNLENPKKMYKVWRRVMEAWDYAKFFKEIMDEYFKNLH
ncbi:MAG: hypothetical protein LBF38_03050 [Deltaproteobacteria bacterium]|nr:hypothetical protein [Deltaproteobacteria bacterium]